MNCVNFFLLYKDLLNQKLDTLKDYHLEWTHIPMKELKPSSDFNNFILNKMDVVAAEGVKMQCGRDFLDGECEP